MENDKEDTSLTIERLIEIHKKQLFSSSEIQYLIKNNVEGVGYISDTLNWWSLQTEIKKLQKKFRDLFKIKELCNYIMDYIFPNEITLEALILWSHNLVFTPIRDNVCNRIKTMNFNTSLEYYLSNKKFTKGLILPNINDIQDIHPIWIKCLNEFEFKLPNLSVLNVCLRLDHDLEKDLFLNFACLSGIQKVYIKLKCVFPLEITYRKAIEFYHSTLSNGGCKEIDAHIGVITQQDYKESKKRKREEPEAKK
jgi:hypothetical protein